MNPKIVLNAFTLRSFNETKAPKPSLDVAFKNESQFLGKGNGQQKCEDLKFPFSRSHLKNVAIKNLNILYEPENNFELAKDVREVTLDAHDFKEFDWQPGDTVAILPNNANNKIDNLLMLLELDDKADRICSVTISKLCTNKNAKVPAYIPSPTTPREILRDCLNLDSILKKTFLRSLAEYCLDKEEEKFLKCISSKEGSANYNDLIIKRGLTLIDILTVCPTCRPPFCLIIEHLSRLLPRPYSIANSPLETDDEITVIFSTLNRYPGVTTKMLKEKSTEKTSSILMYLREPNYFRYTEDNYQENQILIAIGTGLAPFLGFLQHKQHLMNKNKDKPGITWLFVGTTTQEAVIHREQLLQWQSKNILNNLVETYSRIKSARFHYVQDALEYNAQQLVELLMKQETNLYLCADGGQISKSIENSLQNILAKQLAISESESAKMLKDFKTQNKYIEDIWL